MALILDGTNGLSDVDGSASTPAIRGTDTNTGIFFPAADTIGFAEGGVEAMRIDSSGNVGIGTSSPSSMLSVVAPNTTSPLLISNATTGSSRINASWNSDNIWLRMFNTAGTETVRFTTNSDSYITAGNVGIGTSSPANRLDVQVSSNVRTARFKNTSTTVQDYNLFAANDSDVVIGLGVYGSTAGTAGMLSANSVFLSTAAADMNIITSNASGVIKFGTNGTERMRITNTGNVGIGTSSPDQRLDVRGSGGISVKVQSSNSSAQLILNSSGTNVSYINYGQTGANPLAFYDSNSATERMRIDSSGNLLVNTTGQYASSKLCVTGSGAFNTGGVDGTFTSFVNAVYSGDTTQFASIQHSMSSVANDSGFRFLGGGAGAGGTTQQKLLDLTRGRTIFYTGDTERMRIDSSGVLLINRTSYPSGVTSSCKFQVMGVNGEWTTALENPGAIPYGMYMRYSGASPNGISNEFFRCEDATTNPRFYVRSNGGIGNYSANDVNLSDAREKTNIELAGSYLEKICAIPVKTFNYIDQNLEEDDGLTLGVIAQDVQAVAPELVMESNWASKDQPEKMRLSIYQTDLQYALMKCIQELKAELDTVKAELNTLKGN